MKDIHTEEIGSGDGLSTPYEKKTDGCSAKC
jgi:hypothetical protein